MRDDKQYLKDIVEAAELILLQVSGRSLEEFISVKMLQQSILFSFTIIGEASNKLSSEIKKKYPEIEWSAMIGFRNIIVHAYFSLNLKTVWSAARRRVEPLAQQVGAILRHDFPDVGSRLD